MGYPEALVAQKFRYWLVVTHRGVREKLFLESPLRVPIFSTSKQAAEFRGALIQIMDRSLRAEVWISKRKWPSRRLQYVENPKGALFDPPPSECRRAILMKPGRTIKLVAA
jgi:hypothetical protein